MDISPDRQSACFDKGLDDLLGRSRIGRGLEHDQLPGVKMRRRLLHDMVDIGSVRLLVLVERGWDANQHDINIGHDIESGGRTESPVPHKSRGSGLHS